MRIYSKNVPAECIAKRPKTRHYFKCKDCQKLGIKVIKVRINVLGITAQGNDGLGDEKSEELLE
jgi:hypothetical protein